MSIAHDLFAETNPAFGTFGLVGFCRKYTQSFDRGPVLALAYIALPIAMSDDLERSFKETASKTGLLSWLTRYPDIRIDLGERLDASREVVSAALRFGIGTGALALASDGTIKRGPRAPSATPVDKLPEASKRMIKRAERLGTWMGSAGSPASIFSAFGVTP